MKMVFKLALAAAALGSLPGRAAADRRAFTFTYEYPTQPGGNIEIELWNTQSRAGLGDDGGASFLQQQLEIEYGITDKTSVSIYQTLEQGTGVPYHYATTKLELRHRLAERGEWPVDVTLYGELAKPFGEAAVAFEPKLILARDFGQVTAAANAIAEFEVAKEQTATGSETELIVEELGWAGGVTYEVVPQLKVGAEIWGAIVDPRGAAEVETWAGPAASWAPTTRLWLTATGGLGLTDASADLVVRFILAVGL